jgi:muramoyltetrapeptide carboxypeptidase LdcA involved in peptidoglycan recycling
MKQYLTNTIVKHKNEYIDKILFIEELGFESSPTRVSSCLYFMKQNGVFDKIKGIWIGNYEHPSGFSLEKIVLDTLGDTFDFPIVKSNNFGHIDKKTVIPIGTLAKIDTSLDKKVILLENCVK